MNKKYLFINALILILAWSCSKNNTDNFTLKGTITGLKKGTVYLQKNLDSTIVTLDSLLISGQKQFELSTNLEEPIVLYLSLSKNDNENLRLPFFANVGITEIKTSLENFNLDAKIQGSEQQVLLDNYLKVMKRYNDQNLDLIEARFTAMQAKDSLAVDSILRRSSNIFKLKYAHTINFALNNNTSEVAPYLAVYEIPNANPVYLDSIYKNLSDNIKQSFYGKELKGIIENVMPAQ